MATKLYFHAATSTVAGTLPSTKQSPTTTVKDVDAQNVNRAMDTTIGTGQTSLVLTSNASASAQGYYFGRFVSPALSGTGSVGAGTNTFQFAVQESNANANFPVTTNGTIPLYVYVWRPSTGAKVGEIFNGASGTIAEATTSELGRSSTFAGTNVTYQQGDVICMEVIFTVTQANATARTDTFYYDGNAEGDTANYATFLNLVSTVTFIQLTRVTTQKTLKYALNARLANLETLKYALKKRIPTQRTTLYALRKIIPTLRTLKYQLKARLQTPRIVKYKLTARLKDINTLKYALKKRIPTQKTLKYKLLQRVPSLVDNAVAFLVAMYDFDSTKHLCTENNTDVVPSRWWLWSDNKLAMNAFWRWGRADLGDSINSKIEQYLTDNPGVSFKSMFAAIIGPNSAVSFKPKSNVNLTDAIWYETESGPDDLDYTLYADIAFLKALYLYNNGDVTTAQTVYTAGANMYDGIGLADTVFDGTFYSTYKMAIWKYVSDATTLTPKFQSPVDLFHRNQINTGGVGVEDGGIRVTYRSNGGHTDMEVDTGQHANTETTSLVLLLQGISTQRRVKYALKQKVATMRTLVYALQIVGLTRVPTVRTLEYGLKLRVPIQRTLKYKLTARLATLKTLKYGLKARVPTLRTLKYDLRHRIPTQRTTLYALKKRIPTLRTVKYALRLKVTTAKTIKYALRLKVPTFRTIKYGLTARVQTPRTIKYELKARIAKEEFLKYGLNARRQTQKTIKYALRLQVASQRTIKYDLKARLATQKTLIYNLLVTLRIYAAQSTTAHVGNLSTTNLDYEVSES